MTLLRTALTAFTAAQKGSDARVERDQVDLLVKGFRLAIASTIVGPVLTAWLLQDFIGPWFAWGPAAVIYLLHMERYFFLRRFGTSRPLRAETAPPCFIRSHWPR